MKILLGRAFVDREAPLTTMDCIAGRSFCHDVGGSGLPLLDVALTVFTFFVFDRAYSLTRQEGSVLALRLGPGLNSLGLNVAQTDLDHQYPLSYLLSECKSDAQ
jgi:hypothetical protein